MSPYWPPRVKDWSYLNVFISAYCIYAYLFRRDLILGPDVWKSAESFNDYALLPWSEFAHVDPRFAQTSSIWLLPLGLLIANMVLYFSFRFEYIQGIRGALLTQMLLVFIYGMQYLHARQKSKLIPVESSWQPWVFLAIITFWLLWPAVLICEAPMLNMSVKQRTRT